MVTTNCYRVQTITKQYCGAYQPVPYMVKHLDECLQRRKHAASGLRALIRVRRLGYPSVVAGDKEKISTTFSTCNT
jgi:hypothetical protein